MDDSSNIVMPSHLKRMDLNFNPFPVTPDSSFYFISSKLEKNLTELLHCIEARKGFMLVTGDVGKGKTTLSRRLISLLKEEGTQVSLVFNSFLHGESLLEAINRDFGIDDEVGVGSKLKALNDHLLKLYEARKNCVIVIDDAQHLDIESLELVRQISNLETNQAKLVQIILIAQPEILKTIDLPDIRQLKSRIALHVQLTAFSEPEIQDYVSYRLNVAGHCGRIKMTRPALKLLKKLSGGVPRKINLIMDRCLYILSVEKRFKIIEKDIKVASQDIGWSPSNIKDKKPLYGVIAGLVLASGVVAAPYIDTDGEFASRAKGFVNQIVTAVSDTGNTETSHITNISVDVHGVAKGTESQPESNQKLGDLDKHLTAQPALVADADKAEVSEVETPASAVSEIQTKETDHNDQLIQIEEKADLGTESEQDEQSVSQDQGEEPGAVNASIDQAAFDFLAVYGLTEKYDVFVEAVHKDFLPLFERELRDTPWKLVASELPIGEDQASSSLVYEVPGSIGEKRWLFLWKPVYQLDTWVYGQHSDDVSRLQKDLSLLGFYQAPVDGVVGSATKVAIARFQKTLGLAPTGEPDLLTLSQLAALNNNNIKK